MPTKKTEKKLSGGAALKAAGKKPMLLGLTEAQHTLFAEAAEEMGTSMTGFVISAAVEKAKKLQKKS